MSSRAEFRRSSPEEPVGKGTRVGQFSDLADLKERKGHGSSLALAALHISGRKSSIDRESSIDTYTPNSTQYIGFEEHSPFVSEAVQGSWEGRLEHGEVDVDRAIRHGYQNDSSPSECKTEVVSRNGFAGDPSILFLGVFEGHGEHGRLLALDVASFLPTFLENEMKKIGLQKCKDDGIKMLFHSACDAAQRHLLSCDIDVFKSGVNVCFSLILPDKIYISNLGNTRILVVSEASSRQMFRVERASCDANPSSPMELERIQALGGIVGRFEDKNNIPYGSLRIFKDETKMVPGVTSSRMLGNLQAVGCGVLSEPLITEYRLTQRDAFIIVGSEGTWDSIKDDDAARIVSQYSKHGIKCLTSADVLSCYAQRTCKQKKISQEISEVAVVVVNLKQSFTILEEPDISEQEISSLVASRTNEEAFTKSQDLRTVCISKDKLDETNKIFSKLEIICRLNDAEKMEFCERTSSLTQAMKRGDSGDIPQYISEDAMPPTCLTQPCGKTPDHHAFIPSEAIGVPMSHSVRRDNMRYQSDPIQRLLSEEDLPPIRKAPLNLNSLEGITLISQRSQSQLDVWSFSEVGTPRSSDSNGSGRRALASDDMPHRGELRHEGKVHRGVPCSYNSVNALRLSSDSEGSFGRHGSLEDFALLQGVAGIDVVSPLKIRGTSTAFQNRCSFSPSGTRSASIRRPRSTVCLGSLAEGSSTADQSEVVRRTSSNVVVLKDINKFFN